ncbi:hypothetical protein KSS87_016668 [Heliosperma pusillum]|nr:hypothetical protein KSS87_016668 [Heliosperma pusillum]
MKDGKRFIEIAKKVLSMVLKFGIQSYHPDRVIFRSSLGQLGSQPVTFRDLAAAEMIGSSSSSWPDLDMFPLGWLTDPANRNDYNAYAILLPMGNQIPAIFNFGDSNSDTGSFSAAFAGVPYPNGITSFGNFSGRLCDGRLIIDFIAEKLSLPYLSSYLDAIGADFKHGANFASGGTTIMPTNEKLYGFGVSPFSLSQNDINLAPVQGYNFIPDLVHHISQSIEQLHKLGARNFMIHNTGPVGCLPLSLETYPSKAKDEIGCLISVNELAQAFNLLLKDKVSLLRTKLQDSSLVYVDIYSAKYSLIRDAKRYGFLHSFRYCCDECFKNNNPYWNRTIDDQIPANAYCDDPSKYISWDSEHYTEAANYWIANKIFDDSLDEFSPTQ